LRRRSLPLPPPLDRPPLRHTYGRIDLLWLGAAVAPSAAPAATAVPCSGLSSVRGPDEGEIGAVTQLTDDGGASRRSAGARALPHGSGSGSLPGRCGRRYTTAACAS
jgi:hypothetical protein